MTRLLSPMRSGSVSLDELRGEQEQHHHPKHLEVVGSLQISRTLANIPYHRVNFEYHISFPSDLVTLLVYLSLPISRRTS